MFIHRNNISHINMALQRSNFFANGVAYDIPSTIQYLVEIFHTYEADSMEYELYEEIFSRISDAQFVTELDYNTLIPDCFSGTYIHFDTWLLRYGVEDHIMMDLDLIDDNTTIGTFDLSDDIELEGEECITAEEEDDIIIFHNMDAVIHEVIDLTGELSDWNSFFWD